MHLRGDHDSSRPMAETLRPHGLPVPAEETGFSDEESVRAVEFAPETRPGRCTIPEEPELPPVRIGSARADRTAPVAG